MKDYNIIRRLFPGLEGDWSKLNVDDIAVDACKLLNIGPNDPNPFLDPETVDNWMGFVHKLLRCDYSYGGYLEDRSTLWRGDYQKPGELIHLGVDFNVSEGVVVTMPTWGKLVHSFNDPDQNGGWGGKLIFECKQGYLLFGHLKDIPNDIGTKYSPGHKIGVVAEAECNGGWGPHLHLQLMREFNPDVDGYGPYYEGIQKDFFDPLEFL